MNSDPIISSVTAALIGLFWFWTMSGWYGLAGGSLSEVAKKRYFTATVGYTLSIVMAFSGFLIAKDSFPMQTLLQSYFGAALIWINCSGVDYGNSHLWNRPRTMIMFLGGLFIAATVAAILTPSPEYLALITAAAIFGRHNRGSFHLLKITIHNMDMVQSKLESLDSRLMIERQIANLEAESDDNINQAG